MMKDVEEIHGDGIDAAHVDGLLAQLGDDPCREAWTPAIPETIAEK